jgi:alpha-N-acetylglucosamine transferase
MTICLLVLYSFVTGYLCKINIMCYQINANRNISRAISSMHQLSAKPNAVNSAAKLIIAWYLLFANNLFIISPFITHYRSSVRLQG